jgi:hypothetical protein
MSLFVLACLAIFGRSKTVTFNQVRGRLLLFEAGLVMGGDQKDASRYRPCFTPPLASVQDLFSYARRAVFGLFPSPVQNGVMYCL